MGIVQRRFRCPWQIRREIEQIWQMVGDVTRVSHCFREANRVANILANEGVYHQQHACTVYEHIHSYPKLARGNPAWIG